MYAIYMKINIINNIINNINKITEFNYIDSLTFLMAGVPLNICY